MEKPKIRNFSAVIWKWPLLQDLRNIFPGRRATFAAEGRDGGEGGNLPPYLAGTKVGTPVATAAERPFCGEGVTLT